MQMLLDVTPSLNSMFCNFDTTRLRSLWFLFWPEMAFWLTCWSHAIGQDVCIANLCAVCEGWIWPLLEVSASVRQGLWGGAGIGSVLTCTHVTFPSSRRPLPSAHTSGCAHARRNTRPSPLHIRKTACAPAWGQSLRQVMINALYMQVLFYIWKIWEPPCQTVCSKSQQSWMLCTEKKE